MARTYRDTADATAHEILPALGEWADQYDIEAIAEEYLTAAPVEYTADGREIARDEYITVRDDVDFWEIAARHEIKA